jgi:hypothetical protein
VRVEVLDHSLDGPLDKFVALDGIHVVVLDLNEHATELVHRLIWVLIFRGCLSSIAAENETSGEGADRREEDAEDAHGGQLSS